VSGAVLAWLRLRLSYLDWLPLRKPCHAVDPKWTFGPSWFFESRTWTSVRVTRTSTQLAPAVPLNELFRHPDPTHSPRISPPLSHSTATWM
jgi:hypothetical protein